MSIWEEHLAHRRATITSAGQWRTIRSLDGHGPVFVLDDEREVISFASNDYLGLSFHPAVQAAGVDAVQRWGTGSGSSRLVVGDREVHRSLETDLARWKDAECAVVFPTWFSANMGVLSALGGPEVQIVSDERNHASIIDGCRMSRAKVSVSRHGDLAHVAALLGTHDGLSIVVTDTIFSMDGDRAPVEELGDLCREHGALLILDEAHDVFGPGIAPGDGLGLVRVGTLSKTLGSLGGFVASSRSITDLIVNTARSFIFTTAPSPPDMAAAHAALQVLRSTEGEGLVHQLRELVDRLQPGAPSAIIPIIIGDEDTAVRTAAQLLDDFGLLIPAIRPPTVPRGSSRLRIALSAAHTAEHVDRLIDALATLGLDEQLPQIARASSRASVVDGSTRHGT